MRKLTQMNARGSTFAPGDEKLVRFHLAVSLFMRTFHCRKKDESDATHFFAQHVVSCWCTGAFHYLLIHVDGAFIEKFNLFPSPGEKAIFISLTKKLKPKIVESSVSELHHLIHFYTKKKSLITKAHLSYISPFYECAFYTLCTSVLFCSVFLRLGMRVPVTLDFKSYSS